MTIGYASSKTRSEAASNDRLKLSTYKLNTLLGMAQAISSDLRIEGLVERFRGILNDDLGIDRILLYKREGEAWELLLNSNCAPDMVEQIDVERDLLPYGEITFVAATYNTLLLDLDVLIPIEQNNSVVGYVLIGDTKEYEKGVSTTIRHLNFVQTLAIIIFVAMENMRLFRKMLDQEAMRKEMELASRMQNMLIPSPDTMPRYPGIDMASYYNPHFEVGGDYYDVVPLGEGEFGFCIADVSGKGISAALLMSNFQATLRALFDRNIALNEFIAKLNERMMSAAKGEKFITLFVARYSCVNRVMEYVNAGHNSPILYTPHNGAIEHLQRGSVGIGMLDEIPVINVGQLHVPSGAKLVCYTDGLVERTDGNAVLYDTNLVERCISTGGSIANILAMIAKERGVDDHPEDIFDDISMLGFEFK